MAGGRPKFKIDYDLVEKLAGIQCTQQEIASFLGCSVDTLQRDEQFSGIYKKGIENGKMSLRRMQFRLAEKNTSMAIFLGKNYLGQRDVIEQEHGMKNGILDELTTALQKAKEKQNEDTK